MTLNTRIFMMSLMRRVIFMARWQKSAKNHRAKTKIPGKLKNFCYMTSVDLKRCITMYLVMGPLGIIMTITYKQISSLEEKHKNFAKEL